MIEEEQPEELYPVVVCILERIGDADTAHTG